MKTEKTVGMRREEELARQAEERREEIERKARVLTVEDHLNRIAHALAAINQNLARVADALEEAHGLDSAEDPLDDGNTYGRSL